MRKMVVLLKDHVLPIALEATKEVVEDAAARLWQHHRSDTFFSVSPTCVVRFDLIEAIYLADRDSSP